MKSFAACFFALSLAACSSSNGPLGSTGASGGSGSTTGTKSTGTTNTGTGTGAATGSASAGTTGSAFGQPCTLTANEYPDEGGDSCAPEGYECSAVFSTTSSVCVLPQELYECNDDPLGEVGCQDGGQPGYGDAGEQLSCMMGFQFGSGASAESVSVCVWDCASLGDCSSLSETCYMNAVCFSNYCNQDATTGAFDPPFLNTCPVVDAGDGQCFGFLDSTDTQVNVALCLQNGTSKIGDPCTPFSRTGPYSPCDYGSFCYPTPSGDGGLCLPATADGGTCAATDLVLQGPSNGDFGVCVVDCTTSNTCLADGGSDAGELGYGTCQALTGGTSKACLP